MNRPVSFLKAAIGRELTSENFYQTFDDWSSYDHHHHHTQQQQQQHRHHHHQQNFKSSHQNANGNNNVYRPENTREGCSPSDEINGRQAAHFDRQANGSIVVKINKELQKDFEVSLQIRTFDQDGMLFAAMVRRGKKGRREICSEYFI